MRFRSDGSRYSVLARDITAFILWTEKDLLVRRASHMHSVKYALFCGESTSRTGFDFENFGHENQPAEESSRHNFRI